MPEQSKVIPLHTSQKTPTLSVQEKRNIFMGCLGIRHRYELFLSPTRLSQKEIEGFQSVRELIEFVLGKEIKHINHQALHELADELEIE